MLYDYKCHSCAHTFRESLSMADYNVPCEKPCPECGVEGEVKRHIKSCPSMTGISGSGGLENKFKNLDGDWKDMMKAMKKGNPGSTIKDY